MLEDGTVIGFDPASGQDAGVLETEPHDVNMIGQGHGPFRGFSTDEESLFLTFGDNKLFAFGN